jgi:hypothetical protein
MGRTLGPSPTCFISSSILSSLLFASAAPRIRNRIAHSISMALAAAATTFRPRLVVTAKADNTDTRRRHWKAGEFPFPTSSDTPRRSARTAERPPDKPRDEDGDSSRRTGRRHWKAGEFPGTQEDSRRPRRSPIKNVKKRLDARAEAKAWACTVTEALADRIDAKNWQEALQVHSISISLPTSNSNKVAPPYPQSPVYYILHLTT